jgi:glutaminyl-tRNA synthetase
MNAETNAAAGANDPAANPDAPVRPSDFIRDIVAQDLADGRYPGGIITRFPPEPNGYLHIGHAKSICLNFGIALENGGRCHLRMDDTNPAKEDIEYVESITADVKWLIDGWADGVLGLKERGAKPVAGATAGDLRIAAVPGADNASRGAELEPFFASDYLEALFAYAEELIRRGKAYVCDLTPADTEEYRGAPDRPGKPSPWRERSVEESLDLFRRMRAGEFPDGARTLRAKIDMASPNMWLRDPLLYRIRHIVHHHAGAGWCVYPLYDYAHCLSDYLEGVTHSVCTLEFEVHRPLYDWLLESLGLPRALPHQYEFAKLNLAYTIVSKRRLLQLVLEKVVTGWDDPRMPTLAGIRRRGVPASALRAFVTGVGVTKFESLTEIAVYENAVREELNRVAQRRMGVLRPLKLVLTNLADDEVVECTAGNHPNDPEAGVRALALTREVFIDADDFAEVPPPKYFRLKPGGEVRLKYAGIIKFEELVKDADGRVVEVRCTFDHETRTGRAGADRKVKGTIHWVSATKSIDAEVRLYDRLFTVPEPAAQEDFLKVVNPNSLEVVTAKVEPSLAAATAEQRFQFERLGYFTIDPKDGGAGRLVFNRTITLKDTWAK